MDQRYNIPAGKKCPLWRSECCKVCPTCEWFTHVVGRNPNTGEQVDNFRCAIAFLPTLQIETSATVRSSSAAFESFRNEVCERADRAEAKQRVARLVSPSMGQYPLLLERDD
jgi:hypothetical protein